MNLSSDNPRDRSGPFLPLGLGTAQFGLNYGITNRSGQVSRPAAAEMLARAHQMGVRLLDTAALYGDSETVIGLISSTLAFDIVTKVAKVADATSPREAADRIRCSIRQSLERLKTERVHALLLHDADDLLCPYGDAVWQCMEAIRRDGLASKIGVSVYGSRQIDEVLERYDVDIVQLPFNALDARLVEGRQLEALGRRGVEVHARSIFLQGILLLPPDKLPQKLAGLRAGLKVMRDSFTAAGLTLMEGLIASVLHQRSIHRVVIGATNVRELQEIVLATQKVLTLDRTFVPPRWSAPDPRLLNPAMWSALDSGATELK